MASVLSVNVADARAIASKSGWTGIDKRPVGGPVVVRVPDDGASGLAGDVICDSKNHGGPDQAVYAYAREDLDMWGLTLRRSLPCGGFGENLTTLGVDVTGAVIGERWRVGDDLVLEVSVPRIPCRTFAVWLGEAGWLKSFIRRAAPGAYLRVVEPGLIRAGDEVLVESRPPHGVTIGLSFRALTLEPALLHRLLDAPELPEDCHERARRQEPFNFETDD